MSKAKMITVYFYAEASGKQPVREWLLELSEQDRKSIGRDIMTLQFKWPIGMPLVRSLSSGLWEVRSHLKDNIA